uniref:Lysophospholipid acyltransferase family protein n=1 Tax=Desulfatirhabdium butyrativorans TaxID=340467 RepID=A0A7C4RTB7_9BACT
MEKLIDLSTTIEKPFSKLFFSVFQQPIERLLGIEDINGHYGRFYEKIFVQSSNQSVFETLLETMDVRYRCDEAMLQQVPASKSLVVVANHPFGGIEGVILGAMISNIRSDVRILGNYLLKQIRGLGEWIIPVNPFDNRNAYDNVTGLKQALRWLNQGGALIVFPAGEVASWNRKRLMITDPDWSPHVAALIRKSQATTLPVYVPGRNSALFSVAGLLSPRLRTLLLPKELVNKAHRQIPIHIGKPLSWSFLKRKEQDTHLIQYLRTTTEMLRYQKARKQWLADGIAPAFLRHRRRLAPLIPSVAADTLQREIASLPMEQILISTEDQVVCIASSDQIPHVLQEIGRLREQSFRSVREGTGRPLDVDRFDAHYRHLFLFNRKTSEIVGGYRLGLVEEILTAHGRNGLYTNTLFRFHRSFFDPARHMIEFGRSFVRVEYQKKHNSLITIWRGIGEFIRRNPRYKILFGPVSIRNDYHGFSKRLLVRYLMHAHGEPNLSSLVKPRRPYRMGPRIPIHRDPDFTHAEAIEDVSHWISQLEADGKSIPTLVKHYLKLNGKVLGFNIDTDFSEVIDALILVDLDKTDSRIYKRFVGETDA